MLWTIENMDVPRTLPHKSVPSKQPTSTIAPLPPLPPPANPQSGYNPSTSSSPTASPQLSPLPSSARPSRNGTLAPPGPRPRISRSSSPLARIREPKLPDLASMTSSDAVLISPRPEAASVTLNPSITSDVPALPHDVQAETRQPVTGSADIRKSILGARPMSSSFSRPFTTLSTSPSQPSTGPPRPIQKAAFIKNPPPSIAVPPPPTNELQIYAKGRSSKHGPRVAESKRDSHASQESRFSQNSTESQRSQTSSYRSSIDSENDAVARTLSATESIKSNKSSRDEKKRIRKIFLKKKSMMEPISKPMISPPTLIHSASTSQLPELRNRTSIGAANGINVDGVTDSARAKDKSLHAVEKDKTSKLLEVNDTQHLQNSIVLDSTERLKMKKSKTFGLPWTKEQRKPDTIDSLHSSGFFTRTQLPPVKYTRLPVLAVSGSEIDRAREQAGGANVRVSMDLAPVVWYEGRRRTVRMSWQVKQTVREENGGDHGETGGKDGAREKRASWVPGMRFSWSAGEEDTDPLNDYIGNLKNPAGNLKSPSEIVKSSRQNHLDTVGEDAEHEQPRDDLCLGDENKTMESNDARNQEGTQDNSSTAETLNVESSLPLVPNKSPGPSAAASPQLGAAEEPLDEASDGRTAVANNLKESREEAGMPTRGSVSTGELAKVLQEIAEEEEQGNNSMENGIDALFCDSRHELSSNSTRFNLSIRRLTEALASPDSDEGSETEDEQRMPTEEQQAKPVVHQNRISWLLNTGAPSPQEVKILAAVPKHEIETLSETEYDESAGADAHIELKILSAYELPEQAQVLAVIAEEDDEQIPAPVEEGRNSIIGNDMPGRASWPMTVSSPGLPNMRMIGLAELDEDVVETRSDSSASQSNYSDEGSSKMLDSPESTETSTNGTKGTVSHDYHNEEGTTQNISSQVLPLRIKSPEGPITRSPPMGQAPYLPGPVCLMGPENLYRKGSIAGMDVWNDQDTSENAWQASEKALLESILDFFGPVISTSEAICAPEQRLLEDEEDLTFLQAPLLDDMLIREHAAVNIFAERKDRSKPPPLPPPPMSLPRRPLSSSVTERTRSVASSGSGLNVSMRTGSTKKPKAVAVHSPGIGTLIMKRGLF